MRELKRIYENTYVISEVGCAGLVQMYLAVGKEKALLIDCGYGGIDLVSIIRRVTALPVTVICTHGHIDHAFGGYQFDEVYMHPDDMGVYAEHGTKELQEKSWASMDMRMLKLYGISVEQLFRQKEKALSAPKGRVRNLSDRQIFDIGGRTFRVVSMPGHTKGSVLVYDEQEKVLFSGDNLNGQVWMSLPESVSMREYRKQLQHLKDFVMAENITTHYGGHDPRPGNCPKRIRMLLKCADRAIQKGQTGKIIDRGVTRGYVANAGLFVSVLYK